jgi:flagellar P-ring protein precursor FlgI
VAVIRTCTLRVALAALAAASLLAAPALGQQRIADVTVHAGSVPRRLVGYGIVVGLDGTGDRSFAGGSNNGATVRSVLNVLRRFDVDVPSNQLRPRDVAAVLVTAEVSPYLRAGGRFDVQIAALGDATSLRGGVLWTTPLVAGPDEPAVASAQGAMTAARDDTDGYRAYRIANSGRIPDGGVLEVDGVPPQAAEPRLLLRQPDLGTATSIATAIKSAFGDSAASIVDPGVVALVPGARTGKLLAFLAAVDTLPVRLPESARIVISAREGTLAAGGDIRIGTATVSHHGITLQIGGSEVPVPSGALDPKLVRMDRGTSVEDVAAALHAAGAEAAEMAAIFEALRSSGALRAQVVVQ